MERVELLGRVRVWRDATVPCEHFPSRKSAVLLAYLAGAPGRLYTREAVGEALWPECSPERQRSRLRYELTLLRRTLGPEAIVTQGNQWIGIPAQTSSDVAEFEAAAQQGLLLRTPDQRLRRLEAAIQLYVGPFLPGSHEDWAVAKASQLAETCLLVLKKLITDSQTLGASDTAQYWEHRLQQLLRETHEAPYAH